MRVLVCGSRDWADSDMVRDELESLGGMHGRIAEVIHGAARGADRIAGQVARSMGIPVTEYPADWRQHGKAAGPIRNKAMLTTKPDVVVAFKDGFDRSMQRGGTEHMIKIALAAGVPARVVSHEHRDAAGAVG